MVQHTTLGDMATTPPQSRVVSSTDLIGVAEAAELLKVDRSTVVRRISAGKLIPVTVLRGGVIVLDRNDVRAAA